MSGTSSVLGPGDGTPCTDRCPRCGGTFHCGIDDTGPCACTTVTLSSAVLADLRQRYTGCLCVRCLAELSTPAQPAA